MARAKAAKPKAAKQGPAGRGGAIAFAVAVAAIISAAALAFWPAAAAAPEPEPKPTPKERQHSGSSLKKQPQPQHSRDEVAAFAVRAIPALRHYIFSHYAEFASSQLTFRDLKARSCHTCCCLHESLPRSPKPHWPHAPVISAAAIAGAFGRGVRYGVRGAQD